MRGVAALGASGCRELELRREEPDDDAEQHGCRMGCCASWRERHEPVGDQAPLRLANPGGRLEQVDGIPADAGPLNQQEVIQSVERGAEAR